MEQDADQTSAAEQRAFAVAKLKRAASLPRMKDGRRPPMHLDGVSDGERAPGEEKKEDDSTPLSEDKAEVLLDVTARTTTPEPAARPKRRPRSRSRSRGSRDFKGKARATQSPTPRATESPAPSPLINAGDSSPEESPPAPPPSNIPPSPSVISPIPSHFAEQQASRCFMSPDSPLYYPGTSPPTPMLPSLEALQKGLFRSNSASARMIALHKLTGGADSYDSTFPSPSPTPPPPALKFGRNNTLGGGERSAARQAMLRRLAERTRDGDGDITSGDERPPPSMPPSRNTPAGVPSNPMPQLLDISEHSHSRSATPSPPAAVRQHSPERSVEPQLVSIAPEPSVEYERPRRRRSLIVEVEDPPTFFGLPATPTRPPQVASVHAAHTSNPPSIASTDSRGGSAVGVPVFMSATERTHSTQDLFPTTPRKVFHEEDEEQILYPLDSRTQYRDAFEREISWIAEPVPERIPFNEEDGDERPASTSSSRGFEPQYEDPSPRSSDSKELVIESEVSPDTTPSNVPPSPSSIAALSNNASITRASDDAPSPQMYPARLSVASRMQSDRSPLNTEFSEWEEARPVAIETAAPKRACEGGSTSTWEKVKSTFSRSGSTSGRRSRTNSLVTRERRDHTDSSISRESGASLTSAKMDKGDGALSLQQPHTPVMQTPSASASILSLSPHSASRGGVSPVPPASSADLLKYQDAKLFPFPGMRKLEEQRNRVMKAMSPSASSPEISLFPIGTDTTNSSSSSNTPSGMSPENGRDRKLSHQASDTRLLARYSNLNSPPISAAPSSSSNRDYFNLSPQATTPTSGSTSLKLPMNREGVKKWLNAKKLFSSQVSSPSTSSASASQAVVDVRPHKASKKPSLSDLLRARKENELATDWEELGSDKSRTPTSTTTASTLQERQATTTDIIKQTAREIIRNGQDASQQDHTDNERTPKVKVVPTPESNGQSLGSYPDFDTSLPLPSPSEPPSSTTPDPVSSLESTSGSSSTSSQYSQRHSRHSHGSQSQGAVVLGRLDEMLGRGSRSPMWASAIEDPPRKLLLSSPVLQVANSNTVKDRFLFLFNDILVIAKPIVLDHEQLLDTSKPNPLGRKFIVKSVVLLRLLRFSADREEALTKIANHTSAARPLIRTFVHQFTKDPDHAISSLFDRTGNRDDPVALGQLLFRTLEIDRARLGDFLAQRSSKFVLKAYIDGFGLAGMRVDKSLRVFLHSLHVPKRVTPNHNPLEYLLDAFATRWYEANARSVAYDKDLAIRLVRALVQLNDVMHGGIADEPGVTVYPRRNVTSREFLEAFRRYDARALVSDDLLDNIYNSIRRERLTQARNASSGGSPAINITIKRPLPPRLTYRVQSEPIVLRIPQPDPYLMIHLYGQDLVFDPPSLNFVKSSEASFRVTGTSLGSKTITMYRAGPNALKYGGLPLSSSLVVERAFMRNTFQVAFFNQDGEKRRYMFSVDDPLIRHQWTVSLKRQIEWAMTSSINSSATGGSKFHRAAEKTSFKVLQGVLLGTGGSSGHPFPACNNRNGVASFRIPLSPYVNGSIEGSELKAAHARSKSRSKVYHRQGPGKLELELNLSDDDSRDSRDLDGDDGLNDVTAGYDQGQTNRLGIRLWSGPDLEMQCQQNSSIALVLAYLQVGSPDHDTGIL